jgi:hypothetical protein
MLVSVSVSNVLYHFVDKVKVTGDNNLFRDFFEKGGFIWGFALAIVIALVIAGVYYFLACNRSYQLAKLYVWIVVLLLSGTTSYYATSEYAKHSLMVNLEKIDKKARNEAQFAGSAEDIAEALRVADQFKKRLEFEIKKQPNAKIVLFARTNIFWTLLFFVGFSLLFKRFTVFGGATPWGKAHKNRVPVNKKKY